MEPFSDSIEHLVAELARIDVLLKRELAIARDASPDWIPATAQIRHRHRPAAGRLRAIDDGGAEFEFEVPQPAVTPGQAAVFYDDDIVIGGGWID